MEINKDSFPNQKQKPNIVASLPDYLKDPANYDKVMLQIINSVSTKCHHAEVIDMATCENCTKMMLNRRKLLKKLGFKNPAQYLQWRKIHETIRGKIPLPKYNSPIL